MAMLPSHHSLLTWHSLDFNVFKQVDSPELSLLFIHCPYFYFLLYHLPVCYPLHGSCTCPRTLLSWYMLSSGGKNVRGPIISWHRARTLMLILTGGSFTGYQAYSRTLETSTDLHIYLTYAYKCEPKCRLTLFHSVRVLECNSSGIEEINLHILRVV